MPSTPRGVRRVWRASPASFAVIAAFVVASGVGMPALAILLLQRGQSVWLPAFLIALAVAALAYAWRFGLHPRVVADPEALTVVNPSRRTRFGWEDVTVIASGPNGLVVGSEFAQAEAWCIQKSNGAARHGRRTRSDVIVDELGDLRETYDPPLVDDLTGVRIRRARIDDLDLLTKLERAANEASLRHVFPPERYPYPTEAVRSRWHRVLRDRMVQVRVLELVDTPIGFVAYETAGLVRHLAVAPHHRRRGFGSVLLEYALEEMFGAGTAEAELWVLVDNHVARDFYGTHGWIETDDERQAEFAPYPEELRLTRANRAAPRRGSP